MKTFLLTIMALAGLTLSAQSPNVCLSPALGSPFSTGSGTMPRGIVLADFNSDGKQDMATVNPGTNDVSILNGNGTGGFGAPSNYTVNSGPWNIACGDLNNDSKPDLVTCNNGWDLISVILNTGTGSFGAANSFTTGQQPMGIAIGDLNNDGNKDIITSNSGGSTISLLLGAGNGSFGSATNFTVGGSVPQSVAIVDINSDGKMDVVTSNRMSFDISVMMGNGAGSFTATNTYTANAMFPCSIVVDDFNGDGKPDIATGNNDFNIPKAISVFINNGSGSFAAGVTYSAGANGNHQSIANGDINGDGKADLAVINNSELSIIAGTGTGTFGAAMGYTLGFSNQAVAVKDLNMDGRLDIAVPEQSDDVVVLLNRSAIVTASGPTTFCAGGKVTLRATKGGSSYLWNPGGGTTDSLVVTTSGSYSVTITNGMCNSTSNAISITVNPLPTVSISGPNGVCAGQNATLTASGAASYSWLPVMSSGTSIVAAAGNYSVIGTSAAGCTNTATKTLTSTPLPTVSVSGVSAICTGQSATLTASGASTYTWNTGPTTAAIAVNPTVTTTYTVTGTGANGCMNTANKTITVNTLPTATISGNNSVCAGSNANLLAGNGISYLWSTGSSASSIIVSPSVTTTYSVTVTAANGCTNTANKTVTVNALPSLSITAANSICQGNSTNLIASGASTYTWNTGPSTATIIVSPTVSTTYTVTGTAANGCTNTAVKSLSVIPLPTVNAASTSSVLCTGQSATLTASGTAISYNWNPGGPLNPIVVSPTVTSSYTLIGTDANGCTNSTVFTQSVSTCSGIFESGKTSNALVFYPNPNNGSFTISSEKETTLMLADELGRTVETIELDKNNLSYKIENLKAGVYFIYDRENSKAYKIISSN